MVLSVWLCRQIKRDRLKKTGRKSVQLPYANAKFVFRIDKTVYIENTVVIIYKKR